MLSVGKPVLMNTNNVPDTVAISLKYNSMVTGIKSSLLACVGGACNDNAVRSESKKLDDRTICWQEIKGNIETHTANPICDVNNPNTCTQITLGDEPNMTNPQFTVGTDKI